MKSRESSTKKFLAWWLTLHFIIPPLLLLPAVKLISLYTQVFLLRVLHKVRVKIQARFRLQVAGVQGRRGRLKRGTMVLRLFPMLKTHCSLHMHPFMVSTMEHSVGVITQPVLLSQLLHAAIGSGNWSCWLHSRSIAICFCFRISSLAERFVLARPCHHCLYNFRGPTCSPCCYIVTAN